MIVKGDIDTRCFKAGPVHQVFQAGLLIQKRKLMDMRDYQSMDVEARKTVRNELSTEIWDCVYGDVVQDLIEVKAAVNDMDIDKALHIIETLLARLY